MQERLRQEAARTNVQEFAKEQQNCGIRNSWLITSDSQFQRRAIERRIQECLKKQRSQTEDRRKRFEVQFLFIRMWAVDILHTSTLRFMEHLCRFATTCSSSLRGDFVNQPRICFLARLSAGCAPCCRRRRSSSCRRWRGSTRRPQQRGKHG